MARGRFCLYIVLHLPHQHAMFRHVSLALMAGGALLGAAPGAAVINWVTTNGDAGFSGGSEATNSPVTTDADAETIVGSFPEATLGVGQSLVLSGSFNITGNSGTIPGNQIRWGFFDAPGTPTTGAGSGYVGLWASASSTISSADGSTANPFSGSASSVIATSSGSLPAYGSTYNFTLTVNRLDATQMAVSGALTDSGGGTLIEWAETNGAASPASFTYDAVGILIGGTTDATVATFSNVEATLIPEPSIGLLGAFGALSLLFRRRR